ncbi:transglutaminase domain-containing protein [bacterium]|nr:transglutaminase domain-containing protein [bacterium]
MTIQPYSRKGRNASRRRLVAAAAVMALAVSMPALYGQGITRTTGLGLRGSFWKTGDHAMGVRVSGLDQGTSVDVEGAGGDIVFFSRLADRWFLEGSLGVVSRVSVRSSAWSDDDVDVSAVIPILLGGRFDLLSVGVRSALQPYVCAGAGTYWASRTSVDADRVEVAAESDFQPGGYVGLGSHVLACDWFALSADTRYHFVDFSAGNDRSGYQFSLGFAFMWGQKKELFKVLSVRVNVEDIYPAYYRFYNLVPIATVTVRNTAGHAIEVSLRSWIDGVTDGPRHSGFVSIPRGETRDLPVHLIFGPTLLRAETREPAVIRLEIEARSGITLTKSFNAQVVVHGRNAWNGDIDKLPVFVTPEDPEVLAMGRTVLKGDTAGTGPEPERLRQARLLFGAAAGKGVRYRSDPNIPFDRDDRVQTAAETFLLGTGDCDDLVVLFASLLEGAGIATAFVDVRDPEEAAGHVYLMFDTGLPPDRWSEISANEKRSVVRDGGSGRTTLWIPVETTLIQSGFDSAWKEGAAQYAGEAVLRDGLIEGWVKIIDVP